MAEVHERAHSCVLPDIPLAWGISVRVSELGGALQGYTDTLPACNALKLCHRFGRGPNAHITKLSQELIEEIVGHVVCSAALAPVKEWERDLRCFERRCKRKTHITPAMMVDAASFAEEMEDEFMGDVPDSDSDGSAYQERLDMQLDMMASSVHLDRIIRWKARLLQLTPVMADRTSNSDDKKFSTDLYKLLKSHFGTSISLAFKMSCSELEAALDYEMRTTTCYLILPHDWAKESSNSSIFHRMPGVVKPSNLALTEQASKKLGRVMRLLHLKPFVHPLQVNLDHAHQTYKDKYKVTCMHRLSRLDLEKLLKSTAKTHTKSKWPKLINLMPESHSHPVNGCECGACFYLEEDDDEFEMNYDWESHIPSI